MEGAENSEGEGEESQGEEEAEGEGEGGEEGEKGEEASPGQENNQETNNGQETGGRQVVDCLVLDSPFADFRGMVHDVIHSQYKVCGCCINIALSGVLKDCKKKIKKDLTLIKPIEAVPYIEVPTFYLVGKQDIIARPEKVKELFLRTKSLEKEYHTFEGEHPSHRDKFILKKAILFILNEFDRLGLQRTQSTIPKPKLESKKDKQMFNKKLVHEHQMESFVDAPLPKPKDITKPKLLPADVETEHLNLSLNDQIPNGSSKKVEPKQGLDEISGNLDAMKKAPVEPGPQKQGLAMSFSENAPPLQMHKENVPVGAQSPNDKKGQDGVDQPTVTGNSSPK